ncbi:MAG: tetratricopeptide repeat protein [Candidatus Binatia bacterium]
MWGTSPNSTDRHVSRRKLAVLVGVLAFLPYLNSLRGGFTFDDIGLVRENPLITGPVASAAQLFTTTVGPGALYRPLTMLTYLANERWGNSALAYHVVNVCLHVLATIAAFHFAWVLLESPLGATLAAALFAVHPIHTEAVSSIVGRAELLAALLVWIALLALVQGVRRRARQPAWLAVSAGALAAGLLAKESAFMAIPLCAVTYFWVAPASGAKRAARALWPYMVVGVAYLGLRMLVLGTLTLPTRPNLLDNPLAYVPLLPRLCTALVVLWEYLSQLALPLRLSADYSFNTIPVVASVLDFRFVIAVASCATMAVALAWNAKRAPALMLAAALTLVPLGLTANIFFAIGTIKAERLLYVPSFGWCLAGAWLITHTARDQRQRWLALVAVVVVAGAARTWVRNRDWRSNLALFAATVEASPRSAKAHHNLAVAYERRGEVDAAMLHFRKALAIYPPYASAAFGIGEMYEKRGMNTTALEWYATATKLDAHLAKAHFNAGAIHYRRGELGAAEAAFEEGLRYEPASPLLLIGVGLVRLAQGDRVDAEEIVGRAASLADGDPSVARALTHARRALDEEVVP